MHRRTFLKFLGVLPAAGWFTRRMLGISTALAADWSLTEYTTAATSGLDKLFMLDGDAVSGKFESMAFTNLPPRKTASGKTGKLILIHFNDLHNFITIPHAKKGDTHFFSQMHQIMRRIRAQAAPEDTVLFLSAGDDHTGAVMDELVGWDETSFAADPAYRTYGPAGLDIGVIGNHELDRGAKLLALAIEKEAKHPILSANLYGSQYLNQTHYHPAAIGLAGDLRIGFIGLTTPVDTHTGLEEDPKLAVASPTKVLANLLPALADQTDVVIILSHCGFGTKESGNDRYLAEGDVSLAQVAAKLTDKPVVIVGGHTHTALNEKGLDPANIIDGVPILQAGGRGKFLGEFSAELASGASGIKFGQMDAKLHPLKKRDDRVKPDDAKYAGLEHDADYDSAFEEKVVTPLLSQLEGKLKEVVGKVEAGMKIDTEKTYQDRYVAETAMANFMNDAVKTRSATYPNGKIDLALFNATGVNSGLNPGAITFNDWYNVMPYADTLQVGEMTGRQIGEMLDSNAKRIVRPEEAGKIDPASYVSRGFLHFSGGLRYTIVLGGSAADAKATNVTIGGEPLEKVMDKKFKVAFNSYVGAGAYGESWNGKPIGAGVPGDIIGYDLKSIPKLDTGLIYRNEILAYIRETGVISEKTGAKKDGRLAVKV